MASHASNRIPACWTRTAALVLLTGGVFAAAEGGRLRAAGEALREDDDDERHRVEHDDDHHHHDRRHGVHHGHGRQSGFSGLGVALGNEFLAPCYYRYPYDREDRELPLDPETDRPLPAWNGRLTLLGGVGEDDLTWLGGDAEVVTPIGFGLGGEWLRYREEIGDETVTADLFDAGVVWRAFDLPDGMLDISLGYLGFHDDISTESGAHLGAELTWFPLRPLHLSAAASVGGINQVGVERYHLGVGATWRNLGVTLGYRWVEIGDVDLDGWEARFTWWY